MHIKRLDIKFYAYAVTKEGDHNHPCKGRKKVNGT